VPSIFRHLHLFFAMLAVQSEKFVLTMYKNTLVVECGKLEWLMLVYLYDDQLVIVAKAGVE
jgi:hypothetical protein